MAFCYSDPKLYYKCDGKYMTYKYRKGIMYKEILRYTPDIICL